MNTRFPRVRRWVRPAASVVVVLAIAGAGVATYPRWPSWAKDRIARWTGDAESSESSAADSHEGHDRAGQDHAGRGAYQMHLASKNKSGGAVDPHAGPNR